MASEDAGERTLAPTPHRRQQAREQGQVVQSQDLVSAGLLLTSLATLVWMGGSMAETFGRVMTEQLGGDAWIAADPMMVVTRWQAVALATSKVMIPVLGVLLLAAIVLNLGQIGLLFLPEKLQPDFSRVNPGSGLKRIFSAQNAVRLVFGIIKVVIVAWIAYRSVLGRYEEVLGMAGLELAQTGALLWDICTGTCLKVALAMLILAVLDYFWQKYRYEKDLMMTPQEMREEMRNLQGDPQIIARRRQAQRQTAMNRVSKAVPKADVVITNPTELAIAIQYDAETMNAPVIVAKGAGVLAARIRKLALENGVPIVERKPLAQALYRDVDVNKPIPNELYAGVAEVLAYVYQLKGKPLPKAG